MPSIPLNNQEILEDIANATETYSNAWFDMTY
jgi:hypothetical protein